MSDSDKDAIKAKVLEYYRSRSGSFFYPSDVAMELNLDAWTVFQVTEELVKEGHLE